jgi:inner membrane protein
MPTLITHPAIPLAIGLGLGQQKIPLPLLVCGILGSMIPDVDVLTFRLGIPYSAEFGHRGFFHSLLFASAVALLCSFFFRPGRNVFRAFLFLFTSVASHGILDALTNGGLGIALFWPWSDQRYFFPCRPIAVAPIGIHRFITHRGLEVLKSELFWIWQPAFAATIPAITARLLFSRFRANALQPATPPETGRQNR